MNDLQTNLQFLLDQMVVSGQERGVQVAIYFRGELVADAFAGTADARTGVAVSGETLFPVFSTTKGMVATIIHRLVERGAFGYDTPIAALWPEFGAHDKQNITLRHALNHTAGLPVMPRGAGEKDILNWELMCALVADMKPKSAPGERVEYHAITFGWILGEFARRATGQPFPELLHQEICAPLGLHTLFTGVPAALDSSVAWLEEPKAAVSAPASEPEAIPSWIYPLGDWMNRRDTRRACLPASNGVMNARAVARHYAALLPGGVDGVELLPPTRVLEATAPQKRPHDEEPSSIALGYMISPSDDTFGHPGYGGSFGLAHPVEKWAIGFTRNRFGESDCGHQVLEQFKHWLAAHAS